MLMVSMGVSADGFTTDREGRIDWSVPSDELFDFHLDRVRELGSELLGRRLYETMLVWETDPQFRSTPALAAFADAWAALPKVVFSRTLTEVQGNARLATASLGDEVVAALAATDRDVEIGGATLAAQAFALDLVDDIRMFRSPVVLGGGLALLPPSDRRLDLELVECRVFEPGIVYEHYRRVREPDRPATVI